MPVSTLGQLRDWLLSTPRTPLETLRATGSSSEDVTAAISELIAFNHLCRPVMVGSRMLFRRRKGPAVASILDQPIAGSRQRNPFRDLHKVQPWIDILVRGAAQAWKKNPRHLSASLTEAACEGEALLATRLGRPGSDREIALFWELVDR